jgi:Na+-driven multidrug efflux pump
MLPNQLDRQFNFVVITEGLVSIGVAFLLAPKFGGAGIAWAAVAAQLYTIIAFAIVLSRAGLNPFAASRRFSPVPFSPRGVVLSLGTAGSVEEDLDLKVG